jgi:diguanylate cyclase (GGDEF)-like protein
MSAGKSRLVTARRFSASVLPPVAVSLIFAGAVVVGFALWSAHGVDQRSLARQASLARHIVQSQLELVPRDQESVSIWDDAVSRTKLDFDRAWIDDNLGVWMNEYFGQDEVLVLDDRNQPIYAMKQGASIDPQAVAGLLPGLTESIASLRDLVDQGAIDAYLDGIANRPPSVTLLKRIGGGPAIVSVVPIISDTGLLRQPRGTEFLHVAILRLDADLAERLSHQYQLPGLAFSDAPEARSEGQLPLTDASGRIVTFLQWTAILPGLELLAQTMPVFVIAFLAVVVMAFMLSRQVWSKTRALELGRADAEHRAAHDDLTGLPNRASFETLLARTLSQRPARDRRASVLMLDLDRFKHVNDTLGHRAGDELIRAVGQRLGQLLGPHDAIARLGGDEFGIVHVHAPGLEGPFGLSSKIVDAIGKPFDIFGSEAFVGVSIGIATAEGGEADAHELARRADIALYEAKSSGRNRAVSFEEPMNELLQNRQAIESELREALRGGDQLSVAFQPLYDRHGGMVGAEALVRWNNPRLGQISPALFIPVAESTGLIGQVGLFVLRAACVLGAKWPGRTFAVNISPAQLRDPGFPASVFRLLGETGMRAADLELEITEGILLEDGSAATDAINLFRSSGIQIALDDFGTGYSSLNYLKRYPVDRIKIDRSFVGQLAPGSVSVAIVQAMVALAHALDIEVTAEGVETTEQMKVLTELGCDIYQGFLLSAPITPALLEKLLAQPNIRVA